MRPSGSKILAESYNTARLVRHDSSIDKSGEENRKWSWLVLYSIPSVLTKPSKFPSLEVTFVLLSSGEIELKTSCDFKFHSSIKEILQLMM